MAQSAPQPLVDEDPVEVRLGSDNAQLIFSGVHPSEGPAEYVGVEIRTRFLRAGDSVAVDGASNTLRGYFRELAASWKGWQGEREWRAPGDTLILAARHDGVRAVLLRATLREWQIDWSYGPYQPGAWTASVVVAVEIPDLDKVARQLSELLRQK